MSEESVQAGEFNLAIPGRNDRTFGSLFDSRARETEIKKGTDTSEKILEVRRRDYEELSLQLDACKNELLNAGIANLSPEQTKSVLLTQLVVGIPAIVTGLGIIIDCVSIQESRKSKKTGRRGTARVTAGRLMNELCYINGGLYGYPEKDGTIKAKNKGVLDDTNDLIGGVINALNLAVTMMHMKGKHEDPRMFAGVVEEEKTGTKIEVDDIFSERMPEAVEVETPAPTEPAAEKEYDDEAVLFDDDVEKIAKPKKNLLEGIL